MSMVDSLVIYFFKCFLEYGILVCINIDDFVVEGIELFYEYEVVVF